MEPVLGDDCEDTTNEPLSVESESARSVSVGSDEERVVDGLSPSDELEFMEAARPFAGAGNGPPETEINHKKFMKRKIKFCMVQPVEERFS